MDVVYKDVFFHKLEIQTTFIARDKPLAALQFSIDILDKIDEVGKSSPYIYRKSIYFDDSDIRDLIFKGYTVTFKIKPKLRQIEVFSIIGWQEQP